MKTLSSWFMLCLLGAGSLLIVPSLPAAPAQDVPGYEELQAMFRAIDLSGNGAIDAEEWRLASDRLFTLTDLNHDERLDPSELARNAGLRAAYPNLIATAPDVITRAEFVAMRDGWFRAADIDCDGYLSPVEYEILVLARRAGWNDRNRDERINMSELHTILNAAFTRLDTDADGWLSPAETPFLSPREREEMDPGGTGRISRAQLINGYRWLLGADTHNLNRPAPARG